jgi:hypothetical protein
MSVRVCGCGMRVDNFVLYPEESGNGFLQNSDNSYQSNTAMRTSDVTVKYLFIYLCIAYLLILSVAQIVQGWFKSSIVNLCGKASVHICRSGSPWIRKVEVLV